MISLKVKCCAFPAIDGETPRVHRIALDSERIVRVWDPVARHYTTCHQLTDYMQHDIVRLALASQRVRI